MTASTLLYPRQAAEFIASNSVDVVISSDGIKDTAKKIFDLYKSNPQSLAVDRWKLHTLNPKIRDEAALNWVFVSDLLNFSFWSDDSENRYAVDYSGEKWTGYWSLCAAMNRALDEGIAITDPHFYGSLTRSDLEKIFRSDTSCPMPLLDERLMSLHQAANILLQKYDGRFSNVISSCNGSAVALVKIIVDNFETFRDETEYKGQRVAIYKRAQILVGDIWACFGGTSFGSFADINEITAFADYRIPQALVWFGAFRYSDYLMDLLKKDHMFCSGDKEEVEIRGCTIWAIELIVKEMNALVRSDPISPYNETSLTSTDSSAPTQHPTINSIIVDHFMWDYRREHDAEMNAIPFHKIRCIYY